MGGWTIFRPQPTSSSKLLHKYYQISCNYMKFHDFAIIFNIVDDNNNVDNNNNIDINFISWLSWIIISLKISCWIIYHIYTYIHVTRSLVLSKNFMLNHLPYLYIHIHTCNRSSSWSSWIIMRVKRMFTFTQNIKQQPSDPNSLEMNSILGTLNSKKF